MPSPFSFFRKNQKMMLVVFGVALIFVFTVGGVITQLMGTGGSGRGGNPVVLTWVDGKVRESDLMSMRRSRRTLRNFFNETIRTVLKKDPAFQPSLPDILRQEDNDAQLVQTMVLAKKAEQMGLVVSDEAVMHYLQQFTGDTIREEEQFADILANSLQSGVSRGQFYGGFFDSLRQEILSQKMGMLAQQVLGIRPGSPSPLEAYDYYRRLNRRIQAELIALKVDDHLDRVQDKPAEEEILQLYNKYKDEFSYPYQPEPGFKQRLKISFEYVKADFNKFLDREKAKITAEQVKEHYEKYKDNYTAPELPADEEKTGGEDAERENAEPLQQDAEKAEPEKQDKQEPTKKPDQNEKPAADQQDPQPPAPPATPQETKSQPVEKAAEDAPASKEPKSTQNETEADAGKKDTDKQKEPPKEASQETPQDKEKEPPKYRPLEQVEDEIRQNLAMRPANLAIDKALQQIHGKINTYSSQLLAWEAYGEENKEQKPAPPDLYKLAKELHLEADRTPLVDVLEITEDYELGKTYSESNDPISPQSFRRIAFADFTYVEGTPKYKPKKTIGQGSALDFAPPIYLSWKIDESEEHVPSLDKIRGQVKHAWRRAKARKLVEQNAKSLADAARRSDRSLKDRFGNIRDVIETEEFSYYEPISVIMFRAGRQLPMLSEIEGVEKIGQPFMNAVFSLKPGEVRVIWNEPRSIAYLVRIGKDTKTEQQYREDFLASVSNNLPREISYLASSERIELYRQWYQEVEAEMNVQWEQNSDSRR